MCVTPNRSMLFQDLEGVEFGQDDVCCAERKHCECDRARSVRKRAVLRQTDVNRRCASNGWLFLPIVPQATLVTITPFAGPVVPPVGTRPMRSSGFPVGVCEVGNVTSRAAAHKCFE